VGRPLWREVGSVVFSFSGIASADFLRSEYHGTREHITLSLFLRFPKPGGPGSCIYFPQEQSSQSSRRVEMRLIYDRRSVGQSVLLSGSHLEPKTRFFFLSNNCEFLDAGHPLWREDGSVIYSYNCFWSLPEQSLSGPCPAELVTLFFCLIWDSPTWRARYPHLYPPRNRVDQSYPQTLGSLFIVSYDSQGYNGGIPTRLQTGLLATPDVQTLCNFEKDQMENIALLFWCLVY
jgi:hypothetical protein